MQDILKWQQEITWKIEGERLRIKIDKVTEMPH